MKEENSDLIFMDSFRGGDGAAFQKVWNEYYSKLYGYALHFTNDPGGAQEAVIKAFLRLWKVKHTMQRELHIRHFLIRATKQTCLDGLKAIQRRNGKVVSVPDYAALTDLAADASTAADVNIVRAELRAILSREINALPDECREAFQLHIIRKVPVKDIAEKLGIGNQTVRDRVNKALRKLRLGPLRKEI